MGRLYKDGERQSIGDGHVDMACSAIDRACLIEAAMVIEPVTVDAVTKMLFDPDVIEKLRAARPHMSYVTSMATYTGLQREILLIDFSPLPAPNRLHKEHEEMRRIVTTCRELHRKWGMVKSTLRWFNRNATAGATRAIWPAAMQLCPKSPLAKMGAAPVRYNDPPDLPRMLPTIRETATLVANMALMPGNAEPRASSRVRLTLPASTHTHNGTLIALDPLTFNL